VPELYLFPRRATGLSRLIAKVVGPSCLIEVRSGFRTPIGSEFRRIKSHDPGSAGDSVSQHVPVITDCGSPWLRIGRCRRGETRENVTSGCVHNPSTGMVNAAGRGIVFTLRRGPGPVGSVARAPLPSETPQAKSILCKSRRYHEQSQDRVQSPVRLHLSERHAA
jgi:hypothetical protein